MKHPALLFKLPFTHTEQIEIRGSLLSCLVIIERQNNRIANLETQLNFLSFMLEEQIHEIKTFEETWRKPLPNSLHKFKQNS
jgi:hypothetical protein